MINQSKVEPLLQPILKSHSLEKYCFNKLGELGTVNQTIKTKLNCRKKILKFHSLHSNQKRFNFNCLTLSSLYMHQ